LEERKKIKKREANTKKTKSQGEAKRGTEDGGEAIGWVPVLMRDDRGHMMYDPDGHVRYLPHNGPTKKKKETTTKTARLTALPDHANGHKYSSSNQDVNQNENHPLTI
jgi:hypothetical protein